MSVTDIMIIMLLLLVGTASFRAVRYAFRLLRGRNRRQMFAPLFGSLGDGAGHTGLSAICIDVGSASAVADILNVEYENFEVVAVVDSARETALLRELIDRYSLVAVDYRRPADFAPAVCVRTLYRSRRRRFRRLAVVDAVSLSPETDADAAADIALYDYVTVVRGSTALLPYTVERIVAEIASAPVELHEIRTEAGAELSIFLREDVLREGGFASGARHFCSRRDRRRIYETLAVCDGWRQGVRIVAVLAAVVAVAAAVLSIYARSILPAAAAAASAAAILASILFSVRFVSPHLHGWKAFVYAVQNFCEKLLLKISQ